MNTCCQLWPHQERALEEIRPLIEIGNRLCVVSPTGGGKTRIMTELLELGHRAVIYTNRRLLLEQLANVLDEEGFKYGLRMAGQPENLDCPIQLASIQTEDSRVLKRHQRAVHNAHLVLIDEIHLNKSNMMLELLERHGDACLVGFTATPVGLSHIVDHLVLAGTKSELRETGALVPAREFAPDEPDMSKIKRTQTGEYTYKDVRKAIMTQTIFGRVLDHWKRLNPDGRPTLLFACGKPESLWFAQEFEKAGIRAAHIDGNEVYIDGCHYPSDPEVRASVREMSKRGEVPVVCNRFVMREGIDWPWLYHGIFATVFGALSSYLQSGGRLLRAHPSMEACIIQDHGGNWHRHGLMNWDRKWDLEDTDYRLGYRRVRNMKEKKELEPILCPKCYTPRLSGPICPECEYRSTGRVRMVMQANGQLKEVWGNIYKSPRIYKKPDAEKKWVECVMRWGWKGGTFNQARGLFQYENYYQEPPPGLPYMPDDRAPEDWFRRISDVLPKSMFTRK